MAKKKKKRKKLQKEAQKKLHNMSLQQLIEKGKAAFNAKKFRDAISMFKLASKKEGADNEINLLLFRSYLMRENQLRKKGMNIEADIIQKQAVTYMPAIKDLSENDILSYVSTRIGKNAYEAYNEYALTNARLLKAEEYLANQLFITNEWNFADKLDKSIPLRSEAGIVKNAASLMNQGNWEEAMDILRPIPRSSSFSHLRIFCRAMVSFYKEDDKDMLKALSMIPEDFPLNSVAEALKNSVNGNKTSSPAILECLWDGPVNIENDTAKLIDSIKIKNIKQAEQLIQKIAEAIYPADTASAKFYILQIIWKIVLDGFPVYKLQKMSRHLLHENELELLITKMNLQYSERPFKGTGEYFEILKNEFPDLNQRKIAKALILKYIIKKIQNNKEILKNDNKYLKKYKKILGVNSYDNEELVLIEIARESIRLDPYNKKIYEILVELPRTSRPAKTAVENALVPMLDYFPDDPYPCLELASVYYEKNAFRKAENILEEAMKRAPHDRRVIDRHVLALLISAGKNVNRGKFHLVKKDMEKAQELESKKLESFIIAKQIIFDILAYDHDINTTVQNQLENLTFFDRLSVLSILILDIKNNAKEVINNILKYAEKLFNKDLKQIKKLTSPEIVKLLMPLDKDFLSILPSVSIAPIFLIKNKKVLECVNDSDSITLFEFILKSDLFDILKKDVKRRIKNADENHRLLLEFYFVTIRHLKEEVTSSGLFYNVTRQASDQMLEKLRSLSRRLSKHCSGGLKAALETFEFKLLEPFSPFDAIFKGRKGLLDLLEDDYDDDDDDDDPDFYDDYDDYDDYDEKNEDLFGQLDLLGSGIDSEEIDKVLETVEELVDKLDLRGAPDFSIREVRSMIRTDPESRHEFDMIGNSIKQYISRLSREAQIFLHGKRAKKKRRRL
ncbi:Tetratricopeptide domain-containing protein [Candidatus Magnetomoraceae bacterium gMMP-15]